MECDAEEADSRVLFHAAFFPFPSNIILRTVDTDVFVIALGIRKHLSPHCFLWIESGCYSDNSIEYVSIQAIYENLGVNMCDALPGFHAFTGSDYTAAFNNKGKIKPFKIMEGREFQNAFAFIIWFTKSFKMHSHHLVYVRVLIAVL